MKRARYLWFALVLAMLALVAVLLIGKLESIMPQTEDVVTTLDKERQELPSGTTAPGPSFSAEQRRKARELVKTIYSAPIRFHGIVQDQDGIPVEGAQVTYSIINKFWEAGSKRTGVSDETGRFALAGVQGAALTVGVSKNGYDPLYGQSNGSFAYGTAFDPERDRPSPTESDPAVFVLRKKAEADDLVHANRDVSIPKNGTPVEISLTTGRPGADGSGDLRIECWTADQSKDSKGRYEWHCRISVPGGGLLERTDTELSFTAPENGYQAAIEVLMPQSAERWRRDHDTEYWVKLGNNTFARMRLRITTGGDHFASIVSYLNPSGSRNLEYDPTKTITKPGQ